MTTRLIIHAGLHKTGSTYFQELLFLNQQAIRAAGVYVQPDTKLRANHGTAWMAQLGDFRHVEAHVREAQRQRFATLLLSSEDFESLLFAPDRCAALETAVLAAGATLEWHVCLRDPGESFASAYAEMSRHGYVDFGSMFIHALRDGHARVQRERNRYPRWWEFLFDPETTLGELAASISAPIHVHDYRDSTPFPMHRLTEDLELVAAIEMLPAAKARNERISRERVGENIRRIIDAITEPGGLPPLVREALGNHRHPSAEVETACCQALSRRYAPGMLRLLDAGAVPKP